MEKKEEAKWYVLHTFSGYENVAKDNLEIVIENFDLHDRIFDIVIPTQDVIEEKNGKKQVVNRKILPSYIFIKMIYGDDIWHAITRTRGVTGFAGPKGRPLPLTEAEIQKMHLESIACENFKVGDKIEIVEGALEGSFGVITNIDEENKKVTASVEMFGREADVELEYTGFKKVD
ncbi:MAG: transcription termination/antitermination factor NusG [Clostridia bacterium]|nr:transcription termination/antitermination factor NusG [Clostridia bacterium]